MVEPSVKCWPPEAFPAHFSLDEILVMDEAAQSQEMQALHLSSGCMGLASSEAVFASRAVRMRMIVLQAG